MDLIDAAADGAAASGAVESFESAAPAASPTDQPRRAVSDVTAPSVAAAAARVPADTRRLLAELFKAEITTVRRITRDQLR